MSPTSSQWVQRVYDDPQYRDTAWHRILSASDAYITTVCARKLPRHTSAKSYNRLNFEVRLPASAERVCLYCSGAGGRRYR